MDRDNFLYLASSFLLLTVVYAADFPCNCFDENKQYGVHKQASLLKTKADVTSAEDCCTSCKDMDGCEAWTWHEVSKNCSMMKTFDYAMKKEKYHSGQVEEHVKRGSCFDENNLCAYNGHKICEQDNAYLGKRSITRKGIKCQKWNATKPHDPYDVYKNEANIERWGLGDHNHCRTAGWHSPWCHTTAQGEGEGKRWDYCFDDCYTGTLKGQIAKNMAPSIKGFSFVYMVFMLLGVLFIGRDS